MPPPRDQSVLSGAGFAVTESAPVWRIPHPNCRSLGHPFPSRVAVRDAAELKTPASNGGQVRPLLAGIHVTHGAWWPARLRDAGPSRPDHHRRLKTLSVGE